MIGLRSPYRFPFQHARNTKEVHTAEVQDVVSAIMVVDEKKPHWLEITAFIHSVLWNSLFYSNCGLQTVCACAHSPDYNHWMSCIRHCVPG
ncbi:hypothetical protein GDO81_007530 [Engystomops pustulosus]|uniref:Uncharacterized protein n=1 Tax=Engystomops pustulosus TaxID=76066 RepID=A0AAV7C9Q3_ENGPU|nr:hypothetical protein GDO81_007530 [Engystomops pustulosus]